MNRLPSAAADIFESNTWVSNKPHMCPFCAYVNVQGAAPSRPQHTPLVCSVRRTGTPSWLRNPSLRIPTARGCGHVVRLVVWFPRRQPLRRPEPDGKRRVAGFACVPGPAPQGPLHRGCRVHGCTPNCPRQALRLTGSQAKAPAAHRGARLVEVVRGVEMAALLGSNTPRLRTEQL